MTATMLSLARSRYTLPVQFVFLVTNALGVLLSTIYNANTPDLYPNNAHHKLGWLVTWVLSAQVVVGLVGRVAGAFSKSQREDAGAHPSERRSFVPISQAAIDEHQRFHSGHYSPLYRTSNDSGQGTERNTASLRSHSISSSPDALASPSDEMAHKEFAEDDDVLEAESPDLPRNGGALHTLATRVSSKISLRTWRMIIFWYNFVDRTSILLGFITLATGIIALARFFVSFGERETWHVVEADRHDAGGTAAVYRPGALDQRRRLFLAWRLHPGTMGWMLGRTGMGKLSCPPARKRRETSCTDLLCSAVQAWNLRPKSTKKSWTPTAEFAESFLIFFYGSTNIFLEHLGNWGGEWSFEDLEHISITVLFLGGGLVSRLIGCRTCTTTAAR